MFTPSVPFAYVGLADIRKDTMFVEGPLTHKIAHAFMRLCVIEHPTDLCGEVSAFWGSLGALNAPAASRRPSPRRATVRTRRRQPI